MSFIVVANTTDIWGTDLHGDRYARMAESRFAHSRDGRTGQPIQLTENDYRRVAMDGIVFDTVDTGQLTGHAWWWDGWFRFRLTFDDRQIVESGPLTTEWDAFQARPPFGGFPVSPEYQAQVAEYWLR